ncbi:hypothetical protein B0O99DRAFT_526972 [Bisporella sp. PMI_857]|nr:hypothetical protein B0O99DRAFT_526972 [Bisporella sp. PMI_857]
MHQDLRLESERRLICKGSALVRFEYLRWTEYTKRNAARRQPDRDRVAHIKRIFQRAGCRPLDPHHHIPALVDQQHLDAALSHAQRKTLPNNYTSTDTDDGYPELEFPQGIECLRGLHRIQACQELPSVEKWWIVDLYLSGISYELKTMLHEEYANEKKRCDGEIYRKIREYQRLPTQLNCLIAPATCVSFEMLWWAHLHESREKKLRRLFRNYPLLAAGFDALSTIPALFDAGMKITTLHKVMANPCYEEIQHYINHIKAVWDGFMNGIDQGLQRINKCDVNALEFKAPGVSTFDAQELHGPVLGGTLFSDFSYQERTTIWDNILAYRGIIPSLAKFFNDVLFLQACVDGIRRLVTIPRGKSTFATLKDAYKKRKETQLIQISENTCRTVTGSANYCMTLGYLHLIIFVMSNYKYMPKAPVKADLKEMPRAEANQRVLQRCASLAAELGFETPEILTLKDDSISLTNTGTQLLTNISISVTTGKGESVERRSGLPRTETLNRARKYLLLDYLFKEEEEHGEGITSFFVLKCWFIAFFGLWLSSQVSSLHQHVNVNDVDMGEEPQDIISERVSNERRGVEQNISGRSATRHRQSQLKESALFGKGFLK